MRYNGSMFPVAGRAEPVSILLPGLVFACIAALLLGWYVPAFAAEHGVPIIDIALHSREQTLGWMAAYTPAARRGYLVFLALDCVFPVAGAVFTIAVARVALSAFGRERSALRHALWLPVLAAASDLLENALHASLTLLYPTHADFLSGIAWVFTNIKLVFLLGAQGVLFLSVIALATKHLARFKSPSL